MSRALRPSLESRRIARGEVGRTLRSIRDSPREMVGIVVVALALAPIALGSAGGAYLLGGVLADAPGDWPLPALGRSAAGVLWTMAVVASAFRTLASVGRLAQPDLVLAVVPIRDIVAGKLLAEAAIIACWVSLPLVATAVAFGVGLGDPVAALALLAAVLAFAAAALPAGFVLGVAIKHAATRYEPIVRIKTPLAVVLTAGYLAILVSGRVEPLFALSDPLRHWPVSWLADLALLPAGEGSPRRAALGVLAAVAVAAGSLAVAPRIAAVHWLSEPPRTEGRPSPLRGSPGDARESARSGTRLTAPFEAAIATRTRAVATVVWRRTLRSPVRLIYVLYPLFLLVEPARRTVESLSATGTVPLSIPPIVMAYLIWAGGMGFTLNPLGDQGATLPTTLSVPDSARAVVRGRMLVGCLATAPVASVAVGALALASPLSPQGVATLVAATGVGVVAAVALATGIGAALPRFGSVAVSRNRRVVVPGKAAVAVYSTLALALSGSLAVLVYEPVWEPLAAGLSALLSTTTPLSITVPVGRLRAAGAGVLAALAVGPVLSYLYAVRAVAAYRLE